MGDAIPQLRDPSISFSSIAEVRASASVIVFPPIALWLLGTGAAVRARRDPG